MEEREHLLRLCLSIDLSIQAILWVVAMERSREERGRDRDWYSVISDCRG